MPQFAQIHAEEPEDRWEEYTPLTDLPPMHARAIRRMQELSRLPDDWDGYGSPRVSAPARRSAMGTLSLLRSYAIPSMRIDAVSGGGLQFEWEIGSRTLEIEFLPDGSVEYLVADGDEMQEGPVNDRSALLFLLRWLMRY